MYMKTLLGWLVNLIIGILLIVGLIVVTACLAPFLAIAALGFMLWLTILTIGWVIDEAINKRKNKNI